LPAAGSWVRIEAGRTKSDGVVISRIRRPADYFAEVHVTSAESCASFVSAGQISLSSIPAKADKLIGSVDVGSDEKSVCFVAASGLEIGQVVRVTVGDATEVYY